MNIGFDYTQKNQDFLLRTIQQREYHEINLCLRFTSLPSRNTFAVPEVFTGV